MAADDDSDSIVPVTDSEEEDKKAREEFFAFVNSKGVHLPPQPFASVV